MGGKYLACMRWPDGRDNRSTGVYREIVPPERLVYTDSFSDEKGNVVSAAHYGLDGDYREMLVTVTLEDLRGKTKLTLRHEGIPVGAGQDGANVGWRESLDKLAKTLNG